MFDYLAWARRAGQAAFLAALAAFSLQCGLDSEGGSAPAAGGAGASAGGSGGTAGIAAPILTLFIPGGDDADGGANALDELDTPYAPRANETVLRDPRQQTDVTVHASDGQRTVRFALLPNGNTTPEDAALDVTEVVTDVYGYGTVVLTAPSRPTTFLLRASIGTLASSQVRFAVEGKSETTLEVVPLYNGRRPHDRWTASATEELTCAEVLENPTKGQKHQNSSGGNVTLERVPAGVPLAVTLRVEHYALGCVDIVATDEGSVPQRVEVVVTDVQLKLDQSKVELALELDSLDGWVETLQGPLPRVARALRGEAEDDVEALLDAMEASLDDTASFEFGTRRGSEKWDSRVREALGAPAPTILSAPFERWLSAGLAELHGTNAFQGTLSPSDAAAGSAELALDSVFGLTPEDAGFTVENRGSWTVNADVVLIGMALEFSPPAFLVAAAGAPARAEVAAADDMAAALSELLPCSSVTVALDDPNDCSVGCEKLCVRGLERLIAEAADAPLEFAALSIAATGQVGVGPNAELAALSGSWIGKLEYDERRVDVGGVASAESDD